MANKKQKHQPAKPKEVNSGQKIWCENCTEEEGDCRGKCRNRK